MEDTLKKWQDTIEATIADVDFRQDLLDNMDNAKSLLESRGWSFPDSVTTVKVVLDTSTTIHFPVPFQVDVEGDRDGFAC